MRAVVIILANSEFILALFLFMYFFSVKKIKKSQSTIQYIHTILLLLRIPKKQNLKSVDKYDL